MPTSPSPTVSGLPAEKLMAAALGGTPVSSPAFARTPPEVAAREGAAARFEREAQAMAQLQHPNIVALHDYGRRAEGHLFIVMEYVDGADLGRLIHAESGGLSAPHALRRR